MREIFLKMLKEIQGRLKEHGIRSQIKLAINRLKNEPACIQPTSGLSTHGGLAPSHGLINLLSRKYSSSSRLKPSYQLGISGRSGTCLYAQVNGISFKIFFSNNSDKDVLAENCLSRDDEDNNGVHITYVTNINGIGQKSYNIMTVASWSDDAVSDPQWDPQIVINKTVNIIIKAKEWMNFCKASTERFYSYTPITKSKKLLTQASDVLCSKLSGKYPK